MVIGYVIALFFQIKLKGGAWSWDYCVRTGFSRKRFAGFPFNFQYFATLTVFYRELLGLGRMVAVDWEKHSVFGGHPVFEWILKASHFTVHTYVRSH